MSGGQKQQMAASTSLKKQGGKNDRAARTLNADQNTTASQSNFFEEINE